MNEPITSANRIDAEINLKQLAYEHRLEKAKFFSLLTYLKNTDASNELLFSLARKITESHFGNGVYIRGLIEFTNYCINDCYYCGIRKSNESISRYRLTKDEILACCEEGYRVGFRTFVLQGGEDPALTDEILMQLITEIKSLYPDCAITLSIGERTKESYKALYNSGADRYLLRHETASPNHYRKLHPASMSLSKRKQCLLDLKEIGFQVGAGFMVGSPFQTTENLLEDLFFLQELKPHMIGIGPFISHHQTPFRKEKSGSLFLTLQLLALIRLMHPEVLLPATTALSSIDEKGRELGFLAGANVVMPNLSPFNLRKQYDLYDNKLSAGSEAGEGLEALSAQLALIDRTIIIGRGDHPSIKPPKL
ncbi:MAG: [FeFe] hydrogenase H-cluster radical SAM maturase HydE [Clostridia bacterium]